MVIFDIQADDNLLDCEVENERSFFLHCICLIFFPSILCIRNIFVNNLSTTMQARMLIFGTQVDDRLLYR